MSVGTQAISRAEARHFPDRVQTVEWFTIALLIVNIVYSGVVLLYFTPNPVANEAFGCESGTTYIPTSVCYWTKPMPVPGTSSSSLQLFLPVDTPEAKAGRTFGLIMLGAAVVSVYGLATRRRWRGWLTALTVIVAILSWGRWKTVPFSVLAFGDILAILFVASMVALSAVGIFGLLARRKWARTLLVATGAYGTLIGAIWVVKPASFLQVLIGIALILLLLERQGGVVPPLSVRVLSWTVIPVLLIVAMLILHVTLIASSEGITAETLNWRTVYQRTLEHIKVVLVASLIAIATALPLGILITRSYKFSPRTRRIFTAVPQAMLIGAGYAIPWLVTWWLQDPVTIEGAGDLLRALSGPVFWALLVGGGLHWLMYTQTRARPDWGAIDSWRSLAPGVINVANVGQTVPSLAVLGLSMSFLGIGFLPAIFALWIRALLPIVRNTVAGILSVEADIVEAARGMGMTRRQILFRIELPLAMAIIFAGIRTSVVFNVGVGALAFYIGAGGLGHLIAIGIGLSNDAILIAGGVLTALLAVSADFIMDRIEERLVPPASVSPN